jgi:glycosyltransferase involved in cell wall biosynthesis
LNLNLDTARIGSYVKTFPVSFGLKRLGVSFSMHDWLKRQTGENTILHNHGMWQFNGLYPSWIGKQKSIPVITSPRGTLSNWSFNSGSKSKKIFWPLFQKPSLANITCFHATSISEYNEIRSHGFDQPVAIIPNGIDIPEMPSNTIKKNKTLLFLGRVHPKKGIDILLNAWLQVQSSFPEWRVVIAGSDLDILGRGGYLKEIIQYSKKIGCERVEFIGPVYGKEKFELYQSASIFVLPTYSENFGMTVAEALSVGTPAIVSHGAPWEGLEKNNAGWWIELDEKKFAKTFENALSLSDQEIKKIGLNGRSWMKRDFSWDNLALKYIDIYKWLLSGQTSPLPDNVLM